MPYPLAELNQLDQPAFVTALGSIFEDTPQIAAQVWHQRPFANTADLHQKMIEQVDRMSSAEKLQLIQAHPDLGSRTKMAEASVREQTEVGLDRLPPALYDRFHHLNQAYRQQFGFPFIIAVKNHTIDSILTAFETRLQHNLEAEMSQALAEIAQIAAFRLQDRVED
ncbi:MAG: 2-oxo-4-hydroxy-4-carboxy-5-ureidoimidazoline decarboxylase [Elainella sp. Prado103]|jgi:2-oxo-4-hydroxy-4-carboxy-5-ureidoimidazoline decarboxylase|nr:2-oxo-4-hydroxy-4-carboxy-5-ureidoimidazoline decarboxylase [Elainella sp. Prado103]